MSAETWLNTRQNHDLTFNLMSNYTELYIHMNTGVDALHVLKLGNMSRTEMWWFLSLGLTVPQQSMHLTCHVRANAKHS